MAQKMSEAEALAFIGADPPRTAKLATVRLDGRPHVAPIWVALDDDRLMFTTGTDTAKGTAIRRDPRVLPVLRRRASAVLVRDLRR